MDEDLDGLRRQLQQIVARQEAEQVTRTEISAMHTRLDALEHDVAMLTRLEALEQAVAELQERMGTDHGDRQHAGERLQRSSHRT